MSIVARLAAGRAQVREKKEKADDARRWVLLIHQNNQLKDEIRKLNSELSHYRRAAQKNNETVSKLMNPIIADLYKHTFDPDAEYEDSSFDLAVTIHATSPKAYSILAAELCFPSENKIKYRFAKSIAQFPDHVHNTENVDQIVSI